MSAITVTHLQKTFQSKRKAAGLGGSLRALVKPQYASVEAVRSLSFQMEAGELLGFIGKSKCPPRDIENWQFAPLLFWYNFRP